MERSEASGIGHTHAAKLRRSAGLDCGNGTSLDSSVAPSEAWSIFYAFLGLRFATPPGTHDVVALARFYEQITGIIPAGTEDYVELETAPSGIAISSEAAINMLNAGAAKSRANYSMIIDFEVSDVDQERSRLDAIVGSFVMEPTNQPWGNRSMLFRDPDGNLINFFTSGARKLVQRRQEI
jgi:predicted enzyme related to lactoylglutathione lyase